MRIKIAYLGVLFFLIMLSGCVPQETLLPTDALNVTDKSAEYSRKVDNFLIVFDGSSSLFDKFDGRQKFVIAKNTVTRLNKTIPRLDMQSGLRVYGPNLVPYKGYNTLIHGMTTYSTDEMQGAIDKVHGTAGTSPLSKALTLAGDDLRDVDGNLAIILITDALVEESVTLAAAQSLRDKFGARLCIYPILIGDSQDGKAILEKVVKTVGCGFVKEASLIDTPEAMAAYVTTIFYGKMQVRDRDSDGDGVVDSKDKCPNTVKGDAVDSNGCPLDSDGDGVFDAQDKCPKTVRGTHVNADGCPELRSESVTIELKIEFASNQSVVNPVYHEHIKRFADFMQKYPDTTAVIGAHTDNTGSEEYNLKLSQKRADSVRMYIINNFNISPERLTGIGYGISQPVADNNTPSGRQRNRRVDAVISKKIDGN